MNELLALNQKLASLQGELVSEVTTQGFWHVEVFLEEYEITDLNEIIFLHKYLRHVFKQFRKIWMEEGYPNYWEAKDTSKRKFRRHDRELTQIIQTLRSQS